MVDALELIKRAIQQRKPVALRYAKPGKTDGVRIGNPHVLFLTSDAAKPLCLLYQTGGASDSAETLPGWRQFEVTHLSELAILTGEPTFAPAPGYNAHDPRRARALEKVPANVAGPALDG